MTVEQVPYELVKPLRSRAAKDGVSVKDSRDTQWFAAFHEGEIIGCAAVFDMGGRARLKAVWVDPAYRGQGVGLKLTEARMAYIEDDLMSSRVELFTRAHGDFWLSRGFSETGQVLPNGARGYARNL